MNDFKGADVHSSYSSFRQQCAASCSNIFQGVAVATYRCALISLDNGEISTVGAACVCIYFQRLGQYFCWPR